MNVIISFYISTIIIPNTNTEYWIPLVLFFCRTTEETTDADRVVTWRVEKGKTWWLMRNYTSPHMHYGYKRTKESNNLSQKTHYGNKFSREQILVGPNFRGNLISRNSRISRYSIILIVFPSFPVNLRSLPVNLRSLLFNSGTRLVNFSAQLPINFR